MTRIKNLSVFALTLFLTASVSGAADLLVDDFTNPMASFQKGWKNSNDDFLNADLGGGTLALSNTSDKFAAQYFNDLAAPKPSVFTISYVLKSVTPAGEQAGVLFCRGPGPEITGYNVVLHGGNTLIAFRWGNNSGTNLFQAQVSGIKPADNKITVSKQGTLFTLFVNDVYQGRFTDATYASGDVSFLMMPGVSASFGDFRMTDQFTDGEKANFSDDFNGSSLKSEWQFLSSAGAPAINTMVSLKEGAMNINTPNGAGVWAYVDLEMFDFVATAEIRHMGGGKGAYYGIFLSGPGNNEVANFAIMGDGGYAAWVGTGSVNFSLPNSKIYAAHLIGGRTYADTFTVKKAAGSNVYQFFVNSEHLSDLPASSVPFTITGIGFVVQSGLEIAFDNFEVGKDGAASIRDRPAISRKPSAVRNPSHVFYDLKGRKRYSAAANPDRLPGRSSMAAGVYVNENGRDVRVRKDRR
ncbi:MAG: hypothetical protein FWB85_00820 [Chitinispirillia bacterium]|nr:hypothetical protein [Chitinispirillia bacterium]MCL2241044.1 hypothetical protein [Chitinispirillia bacterium]